MDLLHAEFHQLLLTPGIRLQVWQPRLTPDSLDGHCGPSSHSGKTDSDQKEEHSFSALLLLLQRFHEMVHGTSPLSFGVGVHRKLSGHPSDRNLRPSRGYDRLLWNCGGTLGGRIHEVPKTKIKHIQEVGGVLQPREDGIGDDIPQHCQQKPP